MRRHAPDLASYSHVYVDFVVSGEVENVTMLFSDIEGSTSMVTRLGPQWIDVLDAQRRLCRAAWDQWNGTEMGTEGDSFFVVFGEAADAVSAALMAQESINGHTWPGGENVRIRIGVHSGPAVRHETGFVGLDVHRAARVCSAAHGGQTLVTSIVERRLGGQPAGRLVLRDLGTHQLKDLPTPERLFQISTKQLPSIFPPPRTIGAPEQQIAGIADYRFIRAMGESTHGNLFLAVPPARLNLGENLVMVKVISGGDNEATVRRVTRELRAFASVSSPFLVSLLDAGQQGDSFFYAMEHCELGSLASPEIALDRAGVLGAMAEVARAAHALHEAGLVHRGIKPSTVLLRSGGARLADFGLVQALEPTQSMTSLGAIGAVDFVEPGLMSGHPATPASDIWSLAATLHWGLTHEGLYGVLPADDPLFCVRRILTSQPRLSPALAAADAELIERCLTGPPRERPKTALVMAETLERQPRY